MGRVIVVGSVNADLVLRCAHLPRPGETVLAAGMSEGFGGKGANQAVAAARLGAPTALLAAVGDDAAGTAGRADLTAEGVDVTGVVVATGHPTGRATVLVDDAGENAIVVMPGANAALTAQTVVAELARLRPQPGDVVLVSGEVPSECAEAAIRAGPGGGARAVYNLAPFRGPVGWLDELRPLLVLNETEAGQATGLADAGAAAAELARRCGAVVVTRGARGALLVDGAAAREIPADPVRVVDTTGAGDAFCGALAAELAAGEPLRRAVATAVRAGSFAVSGYGARGALATRDDIRLAPRHREDR
jgi:ribokinase